MPPVSALRRHNFRRPNYWKFGFACQRENQSIYRESNIADAANEGNRIHCVNAALDGPAIVVSGIEKIPG
jgi:hypothetical protein